MAKVLVIGESADLRNNLARWLREAGHVTLSAANVRAGIELARSTLPELMIFDLKLSDQHGDRLIRGMRADLRTRSIPFIILSEDASTQDRIRGLELGAEDCITKPCDPRELILRAGVVLRRLEEALSPRPLRIERGALSMDLGRHEVSYHERPLALTPIEFRLLSTLASHPGEVQTRESLLADVWGSVSSLETRTVDTHVRRLREKLGDASHLIETVRGVGYRFKLSEVCSPAA